MKTYTVCTDGCDDVNQIHVDLTEDEAAAVAKVARLVTAASTGGCEPRLYIAPGAHDDYLDAPPVDL